MASRPSILHQDLTGLTPNEMYRQMKARIEGMSGTEVLKELQKLQRYNNDLTDATRQFIPSTRSDNIEGIPAHENLSGAISRISTSFTRKDGIGHKDDAKLEELKELQTKLRDGARMKYFGRQDVEMYVQLLALVDAARRHYPTAAEREVQFQKDFAALEAEDAIVQAQLAELQKAQEALRIQQEAEVARAKEIEDEQNRQIAEQRRYGLPIFENIQKAAREMEQDLLKTPRKQRGDDWEALIVIARALQEHAVGGNTPYVDPDNRVTGVYRRGGEVETGPLAFDFLAVDRMDLQPYESRYPDLVRYLDRALEGMGNPVVETRETVIDGRVTEGMGIFYEGRRLGDEKPKKAPRERKEEKKADAPDVGGTDAPAAQQDAAVVIKVTADDPGKPEPVVVKVVAQPPFRGAGEQLTLLERFAEIRKIVELVREASRDDDIKKILHQDGHDAGDRRRLVGQHRVETVGDQRIHVYTGGVLTDLHRAASIAHTSALGILTGTNTVETVTPGFVNHEAGSLQQMDNLLGARDRVLQHEGLIKALVGEKAYEALIGHANQVLVEIGNPRMEQGTVDTKYGKLPSTQKVLRYDGNGLREHLDDIHLFASMKDADNRYFIPKDIRGKLNAAFETGNADYLDDARILAANELRNRPDNYELTQLVEALNAANRALGVRDMQAIYAQAAVELQREAPALAGIEDAASLRMVLLLARVAERQGHAVSPEDRLYQFVPDAIAQLEANAALLAAEAQNLAWVGGIVPELGEAINRVSSQAVVEEYRVSDAAMQTLDRDIPGWREIKSQRNALGIVLHEAQMIVERGGGELTEVAARMVPHALADVEAHWAALAPHALALEALQAHVPGLQGVLQGLEMAETLNIVRRLSEREKPDQAVLVVRNYLLEVYANARDDYRENPAWDALGAQHQAYLLGRQIYLENQNNEVFTRHVGGETIAWLGEGYRALNAVIEAGRAQPSDKRLVSELDVYIGLAQNGNPLPLMQHMAGIPRVWQLGDNGLAYCNEASLNGTAPGAEALVNLRILARDPQPGGGVLYRVANGDMQRAVKQAHPALVDMNATQEMRFGKTVAIPTPPLTPSGLSEVQRELAALPGWKMTRSGKAVLELEGLDQTTYKALRFSGLYDNAIVPYAPVTFGE
ncbi:MAG: hypothetical protein J0L97_09105, partial [Alphaproteobacteria bacterium]|nr:hypothetical protein [Alphaproteobacteria bacterium]